MRSSVTTLFIIVFVNAFIDFTTATLPEVTSELPENYEVVFVSPLFRHGDRTPAGFYPGTLTTVKDINPPGIAQLTPGGEERVRQLANVLRQRYDTFLGKTYNPREVIARSIDVNRTRATPSIVLSVLYPDERLIPVYTALLTQDMLMRSIYVSKKYRREYEKVLESIEMKAKINKFGSLRRDLLGWTGHDYKDIYEMCEIYHDQVSEKYLGLKTPDWALNVSVQQQLKDLALLSYETFNYNVVQRRLNGDTMTGIANGTINDGRKIQLFGGHEDNIVPFLITLGVFEPHVPAYASCVMVELLRNRNGEHYIKVSYYLGIPSVITTLQIPACTNPCPLETFVQLMRDVIPTDNEIADNDLLSSR